MGARRVTQEQPHRYATEQDLNGSFKVATLPMSDQSNSKLHQSDKYARHNYFEIELFSTCILQNCKSPSYAKDYNYFSLVNFSDASFQKQKSEVLKSTHLVMPGGPGSPNGSITNSDSSSLISQPISNQSASSSSTLEASHLSHLGFPAPWHPTPPPADLRAPSRNFVHGSQLVHGSPSWTSTVPSPCSPGLSPTGETKNHAQQDGLGLVPWDTTR